MSDVALLLLVILGALLVWRGPKVLPRLGAMFGRGLREARQATRERFDDKGDDAG